MNIWNRILNEKINKRLFYYPSLLNALCLLGNRWAMIRSVIGNGGRGSRPATITLTQYFKHIKKCQTFKCYA